MAIGTSVGNANIDVFPFDFLVSKIGARAGNERTKEMREMGTYYRVYKDGVQFRTEGTSGDYMPASLHYKMIAALIDKQARFLFAESPSTIVDVSGAVAQLPEQTQDGVNEEIDRYNLLVREVLRGANNDRQLLQAAKDCFIGKRVSAVVHFGDGHVYVRWVPSTNYITQYIDGDLVLYAHGWVSSEDSHTATYTKTYTKDEQGNIYVEEQKHSSAGTQTITPQTKTLLSRIPAVEVVNGGLLSDTNGTSEVEGLEDYEEWYSKLNSGDIDSLRKSMNPIRYTTDMKPESTESLPSGAGSFWDLSSDTVNPQAKPQVGLLEISMRHSESLRQTLDRVKTAGYEQVDMPNITLESLQGAITSGKSLKALYWGLTVRTKEKAKCWLPALADLVHIIIDGVVAYPDARPQEIEQIQAMDRQFYSVTVANNLPLPEDELEERNADLADVHAQTMSRKAYMQKWLQLTDIEADEELKQIALERQILEDTYAGIPPVDYSDVQGMQGIAT
jgi:hypothetical protein